MQPQQGLLEHFARNFIQLIGPFRVFAALEVGLNGQVIDDHLLRQVALFADCPAAVAFVVAPSFPCVAGIGHENAEAKVNGGQINSFGNNTLFGNSTNGTFNGTIPLQ